MSNILHFGWSKCANVDVKPFSSASYARFELAALEDKLLKIILPSPVPVGATGERVATSAIRRKPNDRWDARNAHSARSRVCADAQGKDIRE